MTRMVKNLSASAGDIKTLVQSLGQEDPLRRAWQPIPAFLPGESHGQRTWLAPAHGIANSRRRLRLTFLSSGSGALIKLVHFIASLKKARVPHFTKGAPKS